MNKSTKQPISFQDLSKISTYQAGVAQSTAHRLLQKHTNACLKPHDLSTMQWFIIGIIYDSGMPGIRLTDLAGKVDTTLSFLTTTINQLEARSILQRTESMEDSRVKMVSVTARFMPKVPAIEADLRNKLRGSLYAKISPEDLRTYIKVLYQFSTLED